MILSLKKVTAVKENWKSIPGYEGVYEVSDQGRVRSLSRKVQRSDGVVRAFPSKLFEPSLVSGYPAVSLTVNNKAVKRYVHELVLEAFVGPRPEGQQVRHYPDPDRRNNCLSNLHWGTGAENVGDHLGRYLTDADVEEIHRMRDAGAYQEEIARKFEVTQGYVSMLLSSKSRPVKKPAKKRRLERRF